MQTYLQAIGAGLIILMAFVLYRAAKGPTSLDRLLAVNMLGTKTMVLILLIGAVFGRLDMFVDIAMTYALLNFIASLAAARFFRRHRITDVDEDETANREAQASETTKETA